MDRRDWFAHAARSGLAGGGALAATRVLADDDGSRDETLARALERLGGADAAVDERLVVDVATDAWSGAFVMVRVDATGLAGVRALHLLRDDHVPASVASLELDGSLPARLGLPIRLDRPARLVALARTDDGWVRGEARVATVGAPGCG